jgi:hypothetical protein
LLEPTATQTNTPPTITDTAMPAMPSPVEFILSYWQNVSNGRYENAWAQLSHRFRQSTHNDDYNDYVQGYQQMNLCRVGVSDVNLLIEQDNFSAVVAAHFTYHTGSQCNSSEYNFEMRLIHDGASNSWLFDKNMVK